MPPRASSLPWLHRACLTALKPEQGQEMEVLIRNLDFTQKHKEKWFI